MQLTFMKALLRDIMLGKPVHSCVNFTQNNICGSLNPRFFLNMAIKCYKCLQYLKAELSFEHEK